jgi:DNA-directed RNA polymerase subunit RPC12/RpoP
MNRQDFRTRNSRELRDPKYKNKVIDVNLDSQIRCPHCNHLFFKGDFKGAIEIKCSDCKKVTSLRQL